MSSKFNKKKDGLTRSKYRRNVQKAIDYDYVQQLIETARSSMDPFKQLEAKEALEFLSQFTNEYYSSGALKDEDAIHDAKLRKSIYDAMNARNRDIFSKLDSNDKLEYASAEDTEESYTVEDELINKIDSEAEEWD